MSQNSSVFRFELNETLYFAKDQKVQEMRGIALDPDITVEAFHDYISIRGMLALTGEYKPIDENEKEQQVMDDTFFTKRYMERVVKTEENRAEFYHQFPVEISVPTYRVRNMNDVKVDIESFDYELPEDDNLKLNATIAVQGIVNEITEEETESPVTQEFREEDTQQKELNTSEGLDAEDKEPFQFEIQEKQEEEPKEESDTDSAAGVPMKEDIASIRPAHTQLLPEETEEMVNNAEEMDKQADQVIPTHLFPSAELEDKAEMKEQEHEAVQPEEPKEQVQIPNMIEQESHSVSQAEDEQVSEQEIETETSGNISYLSDLFRDAEDEYTQMRICIVQDQDTIEKISERFGVSAMQIIKKNELDVEFDVAEGQLLYIPIK